MKRVFLGIDLPRDLKTKIEKLKNQYQLKRFPIKLVEPENSHIAVKFLAELAVDQIQQINQIIPKLIENIKPFEIMIENISVFPNLERPRVLVLNATGNELENVGRKIISQLEELSFVINEKRKYTPHITLGRIKGHLTDAEKKQIANILFSDIMTVNSLQLFESQLTVSGPVYSVINEYKL